MLQGDDHGRVAREPIDVPGGLAVGTQSEGPERHRGLWSIFTGSTCQPEPVQGAFGVTLDRLRRP